MRNDSASGVRSKPVLGLIPGADAAGEWIACGSQSGRLESC